MNGFGAGRSGATRWPRAQPGPHVGRATTQPALVTCLVDPLSEVLNPRERRS